MSNPKLHKSPQSVLDAGNIPGFNTAHSAVWNESNRLQPSLAPDCQLDSFRPFAEYVRSENLLETLAISD